MNDKGAFIERKTNLRIKGIVVDKGAFIERKTNLRIKGIVVFRCVLTSSGRNMDRSSTSYRPVKQLRKEHGSLLFWVQIRVQRWVSDFVMGLFRFYYTTQGRLSTLNYKFSQVIGLVWTQLA